MTTLAQMRTIVARRLSDPGNDTFSTALLDDFINDGIVEMSRIAPRQYQEDIEPDGSNSYALLTESADPRVRVVRVEIWYVAPATVKMYCRLTASAGGLSQETEAGWKVWNGWLELPSGWAEFLANDDTYNLRIWGYAPYTKLVNAGDTTDLGDDEEEAVIDYATLQAYEHLASDRSLFQQWQLQANNTDISFAGLNAIIGTYQGNWRRKSRQLYVIRELPD